MKIEPLKYLIWKEMIYMQKLLAIQLKVMITKFFTWVGSFRNLLKEGLLFFSSTYDVTSSSNYFVKSGQLFTQDMKLKLHLAPSKSFLDSKYRGDSGASTAATIPIVPRNEYSKMILIQCFVK